MADARYRFDPVDGDGWNRIREHRVLERQLRPEIQRLRFKVRTGDQARGWG
jgi:hypothetical protein